MPFDPGQQTQAAGVKEVTARPHPTLEHLHACLPLHVACSAGRKTKATVLAKPFGLAVRLFARGKVVRRETVRVEGAEARPVALQQLPAIPTDVAEVAIPIHLSKLAAMQGRRSVFSLRRSFATPAGCTTPLMAWSELLIVAVRIRIHVLINIVVARPIVVRFPTIRIINSCCPLRGRPLLPASSRTLRRKLGQLPHVHTVRFPVRLVVPFNQHCAPWGLRKHIPVLPRHSRPDIHDFARPPGTQLGRRGVAPEHLELVSSRPVVVWSLIPVPVDDKFG
mmetsp:Transcript_8157/g.16784  ORF Transcript_8157/g.16784 Transcript_8157/m.16784 type:complete len:279 (-) Transcript_8157:370-1206(-)